MSWQPDAGFWRGRRVAVTGATGFFGAHLVAALCDLDARVLAIARGTTPTPEWPGDVERAQGDVQDQPFMESALGQFGVQTLIHLAGQSQVRLANSDPMPSFEANIRGTWTTLEAARLTSTLEGTVVAGSDKVYGAQDTLPYTEEMALRAVSPYDVSKAAADLIAASYANTFGLLVAITRCANLYGPGDTNWERLIPSTLRLVLSGQRPIIHTDGTIVRDYLYVEDGVSSHLQLAEVLATRPELSGQAFNFTAEEPMSVLDVVALVQQAAGTDLEPEVEKARSEETECIHLSAAKARDQLGWQGGRSMVEGLERTIEWYQHAVRA